MTNSAEGPRGVASGVCLKGGAAAAPRTSQWPELHLLVAWLAMVAFLYWFHDVADAVDHAVFAVASLCVWPLLSRGNGVPFLGSLGGTIMGVIFGLQTIDLVFDIAILRGLPLSDGSVTLEPRRLAFFYYHAVLNASHVNAMLLIMILCSFLGPLAGFVRGSPEVRRRFALLGACSSVGAGGYLSVVVPKYLVIRATPTYRAEMFDGWELVVLARAVLYASSLLSLVHLYGIQTGEQRRCGQGDEAPQQKKGC